MTRRSTLFPSTTSVFLIAAFSTATVSAEPLDSKEIYKKVLRGTAWVVNPDSTGTAWIVDRDKKLLITNFHVVAYPDKDRPQNPWIVRKEVKLVFPQFDYGDIVSERKYYRERFDELAIKGKVIATEKNEDLALIEAESLPAGAGELTLTGREPTRKTGPGDRVHSVGNPGASGALWVYTTGTVRAVYKKKFRSEVGSHEFTVLETQAPINPGDSGGPVVNDDGLVVGIVQSGHTNAQLMNLCIHVSELKEFLNNQQNVSDPESASDYLFSGNAHYDRNDWDLAIADFDKAIKLNPRLADAYCVRGQSYMEKHDYDRAIRDLDKAISLDSDNGLFFGARGTAYHWKKEYSRAVADYNQAITHGYKEPVIYFGRGQCYRLTKQYEWAIADYTRVISMNPIHADAYLKRGWCVGQLGREAEELRDYHKAAQLAGPDTETGRIARKNIRVLD